jgi:hypothetical protein
MHAPENFVANLLTRHRVCMQSHYHTAVVSLLACFNQSCCTAFHPLWPATLDSMEAPMSRAVSRNCACEFTPCWDINIAKLGLPLSCFESGFQRLWWEDLRYKTGTSMMHIIYVYIYIIFIIGFCTKLLSHTTQYILVILHILS